MVYTYITQHQQFTNMKKRETFILEVFLAADIGTYYFFSITVTFRSSFIQLWRWPFAVLSFFILFLSLLLSLSSPFFLFLLPVFFSFLTFFFLFDTAWWDEFRVAHFMLPSD